MRAYSQPYRKCCATWTHKTRWPLLKSGSKKTSPPRRQRLAGAQRCVRGCSARSAAHRRHHHPHPRPLLTNPLLSHDCKAQDRRAVRGSSRRTEMCARPQRALGRPPASPPSSSDTPYEAIVIPLEASWRRNACAVQRSLGTPAAAGATTITILH